jgi:B12-binding domain/radical SAM domain protein
LQKELAFVVYYHKDNKYSFNALIGALETDKIIDTIDIYLIKDKDNLISSLKSIFLGYKKIVIGFSFFTTQIWDVHELVNILKKKLQNKAVFIAGGPHPTGDPLGTLRMGFDIAIIGEGEETLIEFFHKIIKNENYRNLKGAAYLDNNGGLINMDKRKQIDLDEYPPFPIKLGRFGAIEITRGCPFLCYFCQTPYILGSYPRHRSIESICKYVEVLKKKSLTDIRFISPNAFSYGSIDGKNLNIPMLEKLLINIKEIIAPEGRIFLGSFPSEVRPEHVAKETLELILEYASNDNIIIGAQSGSQRILDLCHREHTVDDIYKAVELTLSKNIKANVDIIFGLPDETEKDISLTIKMMRDLSTMGAKIHTHSFIPLPKTPFANKNVRQIDDNIKEIIKELTSKGRAFGEWKKQEKLALKIARYFKSSKL